MEKELTQNEFDERVAILKRLRHLLEEQRNKFREYLSVLEQQEKVIETEDSEALSIHTEIEQQIVTSLGSLRKVITPMEKLYEASCTNIHNSKEIPALKTDLDALQKAILIQNKKNCDLLKEHMNSIRVKMTAMRNPYKNTRSIYASNGSTASYINIQG